MSNNRCSVRASGARRRLYVATKSEQDHTGMNMFRCNLEKGKLTMTVPARIFFCRCSKNESSSRVVA